MGWPRRAGDMMSRHLARTLVGSRWLLLFIFYVPFGNNSKLQRSCENTNGVKNTTYLSPGFKFADVLPRLF